MSNNEQCGPWADCPMCDGEMIEVTEEISVFGIPALMVRGNCRKCEGAFVTPEQSRRNKKVVIAAREYAEARLREVLAHRGYFRVEPDGSVRKLVNDEWPISLCSQPSQELSVCVHEVVVHARVWHVGSYVLVRGTGHARALFDAPQVTEDE